MLRAVLFPVLFLVSLVPAQAQVATAPRDTVAETPIDPLVLALGIPDILEIMRLEGLDYGHELAFDLFGAPPSDGWTDTVSEIYEVPRLSELVRRSLSEHLDGQDLAPMLDFFGSELGARIIGLELSARTAILEPEIEALAREVFREILSEGGARLDLLRAFSEANDLVENNVVGALNSNFAFYKGLATGDVFDEPVSEQDLIADIWSEEETIRAETEDWLMGYLALSYQPLSDAELQAYVDFSRTEPGKALNRAIFDAFDDMYVAVSMALGQAAADYLSSQDI